MTKKDLINLYLTFESMKGIKSVEFMYIIIKNKLKIKNEYEAIRELAQPSDKYLEFIQEKNKIINKYAKRNEKNEIIKTDNAIALKEDKVYECEAVIISLENKYKQTIEEYDEQQKKIEEILNEQIDIKLDKIKYDLIPKDQITGEQLEILFPIIKE